MFRRFVFLSIAALLFPAPVSLALDTREIYKIAEPSVVVVLVADAKGEKNSLGSGVIISPTEIVTSCKVVEGAADIVITQGSALRKAALRYKDTERDLCQLHIDEPLPAGKAAVVPTSSTVEIGQELFAISSPRGMDRTLTRTMVSGLQIMPATDARLIGLDMPIAPGSRGGGIFDQEARLIGLITPQFGQVDTPSHAIPAAWFAELTRRAQDQMLAASSAPPSHTGTVDGSTRTVRAETPAADSRWYPAAGDKWHYRILDNKRAIGMMNVEVLESGNGLVRERITKDGSAGFVADRKVPAQLNTESFLPSLALPGGLTMFDLSAYFPPETTIESLGAPRQIRGTLQLHGLGKQNLVWQTKSPRQEHVRVPAGDFDAWMVEAVTNYRSQYGNLRIVYQVWYSPQARRPVKTSMNFIADISAESSSESLELASMEKAH